MRCLIRIRSVEIFILYNVPTNSECPDQIAHLRSSIWSGSLLFAYATKAVLSATLLHNSRYFLSGYVDVALTTQHCIYRARWKETQVLKKRTRKTQTRRRTSGLVRSGYSSFDIHIFLSPDIVLAKREYLDHNGVCGWLGIRNLEYRFFP